MIYKLILMFAILQTSLAAELTDSYKAKLDEITPNFEDNLRRGFNNEGVRMLDRQKNKTIRLEDVAYSKDGVYMSLKNLELINYPDFRVKHFQVDLKNATVNVNLNLGQLTFEGDVQMVNKTMFKDLAMVSNNRMRINITGIRALGRIGIFAVEDSFVPKNYDVDYIMDTIEIEQYENGTNAPRMIEFDKSEYSPAALFSVEMFEKLYTLLNRQLGAVIVEYSINELLLDEDDEIREYKDYLRKRMLSANKIIDNLVNTTKNMRLIQDIEFPTEFILSYKQNTSSIRGSMEGKGTIRGVGTLTRPTDWSLHESGNDRTVFGYLIIKDYRFVYDYQTEYMKNLIEGKITATIYKNKILVRLRTNKKEPCKTELEFDFIELEDIEIDISGLGSLSWLQPNIRAILLGHIRTDTSMKVADFLRRKLMEAHKSGVQCMDV